MTLRGNWPLIATLAVAFITTAVPAKALADGSGEFDGPSAEHLPAISVYNTTPDCPVSEANPYCNWSAPMPVDADNPEAGAQSPFYQNCGYWLAEKRPDIELYGADQFSTGNFTGAAYLTFAEDAGYPISHAPAPGDGVFVPPSHVEYVEIIEPDGSFITSSMGFSDPDLSYGTTIWNSASEAADYDFIGFKSPEQVTVTSATSMAVPKKRGRVRMAMPKKRGRVRIMLSETAQQGKSSELGAIRVIAQQGRTRRALSVTEHGETWTAASVLPRGAWTFQVQVTPPPGLTADPVTPLRLTVR